MPEKASYDYTTELTWTEGKKGKLTAAGLPEVEVATPPEFHGPEGFWSPEHLFVAAANACLMTTFLAIAENSKLSFRGYASSARGKVERVEGEGWRITEIVVQPRVTLANERDKERAHRILVKAEEHCLISRSMKTRVVVEPEVVG